MRAYYVRQLGQGDELQVEIQAPSVQAAASAYGENECATDEAATERYAGNGCRLVVRVDPDDTGTEFVFNVRLKLAPVFEAVPCFAVNDKGGA